jgi:hypothetical protein
MGWDERVEKGKFIAFVFWENGEGKTRARFGLEMLKF